jgi:hypothetical protein
MWILQNSKDLMGNLALYLKTFNFASSFYHLISLHCIAHEELINCCISKMNGEQKYQYLGIDREVLLC